MTRAKKTDRDADEAAATKEARGSVKEAIGKLIGDDAVRRRGSAEKRAGAADAADTPSPRS